MMRRKTGKPRRGLTVVAVLVCLLVITLLGAALLKLTLAERDGNRHLERRLQAEWLLESGLDRALARLAQNRAYTGETWRISASELGLLESSQASGDGKSGEPAAAVVTIHVDRGAGAIGRGRLHIEADYPRDGPLRSRLSRERFLDLEPKKSGAMP